MPVSIGVKTLPEISLAECELAEWNGEGGEIASAGDADNWICIAAIAAPDHPGGAGMVRRRCGGMRVSRALQRGRWKRCAAVGRRQIPRLLRSQPGTKPEFGIDIGLTSACITYQSTGPNRGQVRRREQRMVEDEEFLPVFRAEGF